MDNTHTQIHIHAVYPVQDRNGTLKNEWTNELDHYITGIIQNK